MFRGGTSWLLSRNIAVAALGFLLSLIGALGSAFYLEPAQSTEDAASQEIVLKSTQARMLRAATAYDDIAGHLGGLLFSVSLPRDASDDMRAAIGDLMRRALDHRHDGVRSYLAALAVAGAIDYPAESPRYEALVAAEHANFNIDTYRAANAFEADLAMRMVKAQGDAAMKAITLESDRREAKRVAAERGFKLLAVTMLGSVLVFVATISGSGPKPAAPRANGASRLLIIARMRLKGWNTA
jgi:GGDEF domain-containing protein